MGVDVGATLAKIALQEGEHEARFELLPSHPPDAIASRVQSLSPASVGLTGGGATGVAARIGLPAARIDEFSAWRTGSSQLLRASSSDDVGRHLLVSVGTGTSALLVDGEQGARVGGTALGGGTVLGLGNALIGCNRFDELCALAARGSRERVDLLVSDIYRDTELPLPGAATASAFGKLSLPEEQRSGHTPETREDIAAAVMHLVGENVALICGALAAATDAKAIVFGGSTLRGNQALVTVLEIMSAAMGRKPVILANGEFAGALGALSLGESQ